MTRIHYPFEAVKTIVEQAGIIGEWHRQPNERWRLAVSGDAGLEWSPTRSKLSFYGRPKIQEQLQNAIEKTLKSNLIVSDAQQDAKLETVQTSSAFVYWLIQYMRAGEKCEYPEPLVVCAETLAEEFSVMDDHHGVVGFLMWGDRPNIGRSFGQLTGNCPTRSYSSMLMGWAGMVYDELSLDDLPPEYAVKRAIEAADLEDQFREKTKGGKSWLVSRRTFEERFGLRVRVENLVLPMD
jgi:hypothetical protein